MGREARGRDGEDRWWPGTWSFGGMARSSQQSEGHWRSAAADADGGAGADAAGGVSVLRIMGAAATYGCWLRAGGGGGLAQRVVPLLCAAGGGFALRAAKGTRRLQVRCTFPGHRSCQKALQTPPLPIRNGRGARCVLASGGGGMSSEPSFTMASHSRLRVFVGWAFLFALAINGRTRPYFRENLLFFVALCQYRLFHATFTFFRWPSPSSLPRTRLPLFLCTPSFSCISSNLLLLPPSVICHQLFAA
ncbi:hypothetical protein DL89DRAFT_173554 [Linderina pennispora]|uniref:Uncharacterized protein n=1 Tax=Linderina pennispora TaxID=61395 RepID=A0A1Y1W6S3_9FUNG|nr:uncharacterized protein DL89DRAFT_173554 [Linderina pennispora]ORX69229.1 hypothetical protein DL89DRAFT_173554 [Linderina pennispora]